MGTFVRPRASAPMSGINHGRIDMT